MIPDEELDWEELVARRARRRQRVVMSPDVALAVRRALDAVRPLVEPEPDKKEEQ